VFLAASALATEGKRPLIVSVSSGVGGEITVGGDINPEGLETTYEIKLESDGQHVRATLPGDYAGHEVRLTLTGLEPGTYSFSVLASNSAGEAFQRGEVHVPPGSPCPDGCSTTEPYKPEVSKEALELGRLFAEGAPAREAARQQAAKEQAEREAAAKSVDHLTPAAPITEPSPGTGSVSLAISSVVVQANGAALVRLECLGSATCRGRLTLTAKIASKTKGKKKPARTATIGSVGFAIPGDETKSVKVGLDASGRALLTIDHGHLSASLAILELAPSPENTQTKTVQLVKQKAHGKTKKGSPA